jgi:hypothetical protein
MSKFLESLKEVEKGLIEEKPKKKEFKRHKFGQKIKDEDSSRDSGFYESKKEVAEIFSDAISVALLQVEEKLGEKFDNVDEAKQFVNAIWNFLNNDNENVFNGALERFQRVRSINTGA